MVSCCFDVLYIDPYFRPTERYFRTNKAPFTCYFELPGPGLSNNKFLDTCSPRIRFWNGGTEVPLWWSGLPIIRMSPDTTSTLYVKVPDREKCVPGS